MITVSVTDTIVALAPPTVTFVAPMKLVPVIVSTVPPEVGPDSGLIGGGLVGVPWIAIVGMP